MDIKLENVSKKEVEFTVELDKKEFKEYIGKATKQIGDNMEIEGFRKGKAPQHIVMEKAGKQTVLNQAAQLAVRETYMVAMNKLEKGEVESQDKEIQIVSQPDINIAKMAFDNPFIYKVKAARMPDVKLPDYKKIASGVKKEEVEVTEEELENIKKRKQERADEERKQEILDEIVKKTEAEMPKELLEREEKVMFENTKRNIKQNLGISFEDYLAKIDKTEDEFKKDLSPEAEKRIKNFLVLKQIAKDEEIKVNEDEVMEAIKKSQKTGQEGELPEGQALERAKSYHKELVRNQKVFDLLQEQE